ncbi:MAG: hypothetical protein ACREH8_19815 [Opitutaceae bacterium]
MLRDHSEVERLDPKPLVRVESLTLPARVGRKKTTSKLWPCMAA